DDHFLKVEIDIAGGSAFVDMGTTQFKTVPYAINAETANNVTGLEAIDEGNGIGWRLKGSNPDSYGNIGLHAVDLSAHIFTSSINGATGNYSTAMGYYSTAMGTISTAMGYYSTAMGTRSTALGASTKAMGSYSTAMGSYSTAMGTYSTAMGHNTRASSQVSTAMGRYNIGGGNPTSWVATDPLFEIGNGTSDTDRHNAFSVLKNGNTGIGTHTPNSKLQITNGSDTGLGNNNGYLLLGETNGTNISLDNNEIMARNNGVAADLNLQIEGGNLNIGDGNVTMAGTLYLGDETIRDAGNNALRINAALLPDVD
ncbi:hypothetical protein, partial [Xanthomarina sp. F2636L]|uniref:hypothetical protein n=1 Tax=Xanthomarina sp. F2636L TaxID=2996018 RepID=UPI00225DED83